MEEVGDSLRDVGRVVQLWKWMDNFWGGEG